MNTLTGAFLAASKRPPTLRQPNAPVRLAGVPVAVPAPVWTSTGERVACAFTIFGTPIGKPRMTQRDKWKKRPCVMRYRAWADSARASAPADLPSQPLSVSWVAYLPLPKSWRKPLQDAMRGQLNRHKPDRDNIDKAVCDALWKDDSVIAHGTLEKRWDDGKGPRIEITISQLL